MKGAGKAGGKSAVGKAAAKSFGKTDAVESLCGASGAAGSAEASADVVVEHASAVARALRSGEIATKAEAARRLVAEILKERMNMQSKALESRIAEQLEQDPRLAQTLERIWQRG
ncbi:MAG: hypothetical protein ACOX6T_05640 [Myxococcales bacterium]